MVTIDLSFFSELGTHSPFYIMGVFFIYGGWIPIVYMAWYLAKFFWLKWRRGLYAKTIEYALLAIDIPKENIQSPKAVEHIFSQLTGALSGIDFREKWWYGKIPPSFSFEIVSLGGYVQFLTRTPVKFRDLAEAAFYAQYPEAEITEVDDYAAKVPLVYPNETHDLFGTEYVLAKPSAYPIRTYPQFEHEYSKPGEGFKDPMAGLLEAMSRLSPGEQIWLQFVIIPADSSWRNAGEAIVAKLLGRKPVAKKTILGSVGEMPAKVLQEVFTHTLGLEPAAPTKEETAKIAQLSRVEALIVEAVQLKLSHTGFLTKFRFVYVAEKPVFNKGRAALVKGAFQQLGSLSLNSFKGYGPVTPKSDYSWQRWLEPAKKMDLARNYLYREPSRGAPLYILNIEELATVYHFPMLMVQAPLLKKTEAKRAEPPFKLPVHSGTSSFAKEASPPPEPEEPELPEGLPEV